MLYGSLGEEMMLQFAKKYSYELRINILYANTGAPGKIANCMYTNTGAPRNILNRRVHERVCSYILIIDIQYHGLSLLTLRDQNK